MTRPQIRRGCIIVGISATFCSAASWAVGSNIIAVANAALVVINIGLFIANRERA